MAGEAAGLRREMGLRDVTLFAIATIVGSRWIPSAAHTGPGAVTLWLLAALLFAAPLAVAIGALTAKNPGAGGFYLWTREDFGPWHGFLCFWIYWMGIAFWFPSAAMFYMSAGFYTLGPAYQGLAESRVWLVGVALAAIWIALGTNLVGLRIGKWTQNVGGVANWALGLALIGVAALVWSRRGSATAMNFTPEWNWGTVNYWASMAYGMSGLELASLMGGEIHDPERTVKRAGWMASGFIAAFYALATVSLLVLLRPENISELYGYAQGGDAAGRVLAVGWLSPLFALLVLVSAVGQFGGIGTAVSRLPMAAGADHLLPKAFGRIHPRWATPHVSILTLGAVASALLIAMQIGDTVRAAYQTLVSLMLIGGFLPFFYIFGSAWKAGRRVSAASGLGITALALVCSAAPTEQITNVWLYEGKLAAGTAAMVVSARVVYRRGSAPDGRRPTA